MNMASTLARFLRMKVWRRPKLDWLNYGKRMPEMFYHGCTTQVLIMGSSLQLELGIEGCFLRSVYEGRTPSVGLSRGF